ncbi:hypothetical protein [Streptococcus dentiloxodontae]
MKNQTSKQKREYFLVSGIFLAGILFYMAVRIGFLYFSLQLGSTNSLLQTINQQGGLLMAMDELLIFSAILFGCTFYKVGNTYFQKDSILTGLLKASFTLLLMAWLLIVLETGRLVYPVNGLPVVTGDNLQAALAKIYAVWHLCDILLGLFLVSWSLLLSHSFWKYSGVTIGLMQILCTYFGQSIKPVPLLIAILLSTIWLLKRWQYFGQQNVS